MCCWVQAGVLTWRFLQTHSQFSVCTVYLTDSQCVHSSPTACLGLFIFAIPVIFGFLCYFWFCFPGLFPFFTFTQLKGISFFFFLSLLGICGESSYSCEHSTALSCTQELVCARSLLIPIQVSMSLHVPALPSTCGSFTPTFPFPPSRHAAESFGHPAFRSHTPAATRTADTRGCRVTGNVSHQHWWALVVPSEWGGQEHSSWATYGGKPFFSSVLPRRCPAGFHGARGCVGVAISASWQPSRPPLSETLRGFKPIYISLIFPSSHRDTVCF